MARFHIPRRQGYVVAILGAVTGFYIWNEPLKRYAEDHFPNKDLNKVSFIFMRKIYPMSRNKPLMNVASKVAAGAIVVVGCVFFYKISLQHYITTSSRKRAEREANILYEKYKEKERRLDEMDAT